MEDGDDNACVDVEWVCKDAPAGDGIKLSSFKYLKLVSPELEMGGMCSDADTRLLKLLVMVVVVVVVGCLTLVLLPFS